jgi:hypothetical protein
MHPPGVGGMSAVVRDGSIIIVVWTRCAQSGRIWVIEEFATGEEERKVWEKLWPFGT